MAEVLGKQPRPKGPRLTILTNAGGPAVLATDALVANGGELAVLSEKTEQALDGFLPPHWSHNNPIDILGDADSERYAKAIEIASKDPNSDGLLVILAPQGMTDPAAVAERLKPYAQSSGKPLLTSWMEGPASPKARPSSMPPVSPHSPFPTRPPGPSPTCGATAITCAASTETPALAEGGELDPDSRHQAEHIIEIARSQGRGLLNEFESKQVLSCYGIPTVETQIARTEDEAVSCAHALGYPVVLKIFSQTITHKTDVGGVMLNLEDEASVRSAFQAIKSSVAEKVGPDHFSGVTVQPMVRLEGYELILGSSIDPQFGPVILFGSGGPLVEVYRDRALALPPLNSTLAQRMMEQTRIFTALEGVRGRKPVDLPALESLLVRFSQLVIEQPWISEIDINPTLASPGQFLALDARVLLHPPGTDPHCLPGRRFGRTLRSMFRRG